MENMNALSIARLEERIASQSRDIATLSETVDGMEKKVTELRDALLGQTSFFKGVRFAVSVIWVVAAGAIAAVINKVFNFVSSA